jgi:voltage-dependent potassium channel beta subunit
MRYVNLGHSGLKVSRVSIGAWLTYGDSVGAEAAKPILRHAIESGINMIDTADIYARGEAERVIAPVLKEVPRHHLVLATKCFWPMSNDSNDRGLSRKHIIESVEGSLKRLQQDYVDIMYCHRFDENTPLEETVRAMGDVIRQGKVLYWGTSCWTADQLADVHRIASDLGVPRPIVEQPCYNLLERSIEATILPKAQSLGMGVAPWSPLAGGILTGKYNDGRPAGSRGADSKWLDGNLVPENIARVRKFCLIAQEAGIAPEALALAWLLHQKGIDTVITGATRIEHVDKNLVAAELELEPALVQQVSDVFAPEV